MYQLAKKIAVPALTFAILAGCEKKQEGFVIGKVIRNDENSASSYAPKAEVFRTKPSRSAKTLLFKLKALLVRFIR